MFHGPQGPARWADAKLVRFADDMVIQARKWTVELTDWVESKLEGKFELEINREKTRVVGGTSTGSWPTVSRCIWDGAVKGRIARRKG